MKRITLLIIALLGVSVASLLAQTKEVMNVEIKDFGTFTITKGFVKANQNFYKSCSFVVESKGDEVLVENILVNGCEARVYILRDGNKVQYTVKMPAGMKVPVGSIFDVQVTITDPGSGFLMGTEVSLDGDGEVDGGPGGPGGGGDPTIVVIKYP